MTEKKDAKRTPDKAAGKAVENIKGVGFPEPNGVLNEFDTKIVEIELAGAKVRKNK